MLSNVIAAAHSFVKVDQSVLIKKVIVRLRFFDCKIAGVQNAEHC